MNKVAVLNDYGPQPAGPCRDFPPRGRRVIDRIALMIGAAFLCSSTLLMAQAGSLDQTFGNGGIVTTENTSQAVATAIQSDGKILVAGSIPNNQNFPQAGVARYNINGSLDSSFGSGGFVVISGNPAFGIAIQSDEKIVIGAAGSLSLHVIRLNTNGSLDTTFGSGGIASFRQFGLFYNQLTGGVVVQPNGDILVAALNPANGNRALVRLVTNGQLDSTFGTGGGAGLIAGPQTLGLLPSGKILVASSSFFASGGVTRYNSNGGLDTTFGVRGQAPSLGPASAIVPLSNGQFIVAGTLDSAAPLTGTAPQAFALVRYNANGTIDTTFGTLGGAVTPFPGNAYAAAFAVAVQSNGDIVAAGQTAVNNQNGASSFALARYTANGQLDTTFGTGGLVTTAFGNNSAFVSALAIQADGKIVAVGNGGGDTDDGFTLARYLAQ